MKKQYINPAMEVIKIQTQQFLAQSLGTNGNPVNPIYSDAPELYWDEEMDEFEEY